MITIDDNFRCSLVHRDPLIICNFGYPFKGPSAICPHLHGKRAYFIMGAWWSLLDRQILSDLAEGYRYFTREYPNCVYMFMVNDKDEKSVLDTLGVPSIICNHNSFIDERMFFVDEGAEKRWCATLTARPEPFKRHLLARLVPDVALTFFSHGLTDSERRYLDMLRRKAPGIKALNLDEDGRYRLFGHKEMNAVYNGSRVGLSLSAVEGSNYSCTEYMLCGLPVVSTVSRGGRDHFLDPRFSRIVEPDEAAVLRGVKELLALNPNPHFVRAETLARMHADRETFVMLVQSILNVEGSSCDFAPLWPEVFVHRMIGPLGEAAFLEHIAV